MNDESDLSRRDPSHPQSSKDAQIPEKKPGLDNKADEFEEAETRKRRRRDSSTRCPVDGCQGIGHLSGLYETHGSRETCPLFHNLAKEACQELLAKRKLVKVQQSTIKNKNLAKKSWAALVNERRALATKLKVEKEKTEEEEEEERRPREDREPELATITTAEDLELFRLAQTQLAEDMETDELACGTRNTKQICWLQFGEFEIQAWYPSEYPDRLARLYKVFICEFCLKCVSSATLLRRHGSKCVWRHPPGNEIYRDGELSFWEVDGKTSKIYCQNLCLLAKLFLDHKTLYYDVGPFLFYVMTLADKTGCHMIGYFSKEKESLMNCNLSCILTLPAYQRKGYGRLLIDFSYLLSRVEDKIGSPEHPLSDMGLLTYRNYWKDVILSRLVWMQGRDKVSIKELSADTGIHVNDIISTLQFLGMIKYWKGNYILHNKPEILKEFRKKQKEAGARQELNEELLHWRPFLDADDEEYDDDDDDS